MAEMKRKGLFPQDGTLEEFRKLYGTSDKLSSLHGELSNVENMLDQSLNDFGSFVDAFDLSEVDVKIPGKESDPFRLPDIESLTESEVTPSSIDLDLSTSINDWYEESLSKLDESAPNYDAQLKNLNIEKEKQENVRSNLAIQNLATDNLNNFSGSDTWNPMVEISSSMQIASALDADATKEEQQQATLADRYKKQQGLTKELTGLHSWMWPEQVNLKSIGKSSEEGIKDTEFELANKLWTIGEEWDGSVDNTLVPVMEKQYPGFKFTTAERTSKFGQGKYGSIAINVEAPDGEKTTILAGAKETMFNEGADINNFIVSQKSKLTNFINKKGIDLSKVGKSMSSTVQDYNDLLNTPYNESDVKLGGIGLDEAQKSASLNYGVNSYEVNKKGDIEYKFQYNPDLFHDPAYDNYINNKGSELVDKGILTDVDLQNPNSEETKAKVKKQLLSDFGEWQGDPTIPGDFKQVITNVGPWKGIIHAIDYEDRYLQYGKDSKTYKNTKKRLEASYKSAGVPLTEEVIKTVVAQEAKQKYDNGAIDANLNEYLWKSDNNNKAQALAAFSSITTKDAKLNTAMGLQLLNEAEVSNYNKMSPDLAIVDLFEEVYNDTNQSFDVVGLSDSEIATLKNGKQVPISTFNNYIEAKERRNSKMDSMLERRKKQWKLQDEAGDVTANIKLLEKEYNTWNSSLATLGLAFSDIGVGVGYVAGKALKYLGPGGAAYFAGESISMFTGEENKFTEFWDEWDKEWASGYDDYSRWKDDVREQYGREVSFHEDRFGRGGAFSPGNFGRFAAQEVAKQIPILATMIATGGTAGPILIGAYSAGQHWADADRKEYLTGKKESEWKQAAQAIGYGASEAIFERLTTVPILSRGGKLMKDLGEESMLTYKNAMKQYYKENALHVATDPILEASAEFGTQITQNWIDGKSDLLEGADHAAFVGGMFGHAMSVSPFVAGAVARQFTDYNSFSEFKKKQDQINNLEVQLSTYSRLDPENLKGIKLRTDNIENLKKEQEAFLNKQYNGIVETMDDKSLEAFIQVTSKQADISAEVNEMLDAGNNNPVLLETFKNEFDNAQNVRDIFRSSKQFSNDFKLLASNDKGAYDSYIQKAKDKLAKENKGDQIRDDQIIPTAQDIYRGELIDKDFDSVKGSKGKKYKKFNDNSSGIDYIDQAVKTSKEKINSDESLSDSEKKTKINNLEKGISDAKNGIKKGDVDGWALTLDANGVITTDPGKIKTSEVLGFRENAIKNNTTQVFTHEAGHATMGDILGYDAKAFEPMAGEIVDFLKTEHKDIWLAMNLKRGSELQKADEIVMNFFEYVSKGDIDLSSKKGGLLSSSFGFSLNKIFKNNKKKTIDFHGSQGTIEYMIGLGKAISEGRVTKETVAEAKKSKVITDAKNKYNEAKNKFESEQIDIIAKKVLEKMGVKKSNLKFSTAQEYTKASEVVAEMNKLISENKKSPVPGYKNKLANLTKRFKELKDTRISEKVPAFKKGENNKERKERSNLTERSFRGKLDDRGGAAMNEIVKGYEEKMLQLAIKNGYFKTDAYQSFDSVEEANQEFLSEARIALIKGIRTFDATKNNDFDAFIMGQLLGNKVKDAHNAIVKRYGNKEGGFTTGLEAASGVAASKENIVQQFDKTLGEVFNISKGDPLYNAATEAVVEVIKNGLPEFKYTQRKKKGKGETVTLEQVRKTIESNPTGEARRQAERDLAGILKAVKSDLESRFENALDKTVKKELLNSKIYNETLIKSRPDLMKILPIEDLVALERLVKDGEKILTKVVKKDLNPTEVKKYEGSGNLTTATTTQGPTLYERLDPKTKQFVDFFNKRGRKDALSKIISGEFGLNATMEVLTDQKLVDEISKDNPAIKEQIGEQVLKDLALALKRGTGFKFSIAAQVGMDERLADQYKELQPDIIDAIIANGVSNVESVKLAVNNVLSDPKWKSHRVKVKDIFEKLLKPYRSAIEQKGDVNIELLDYITSVEVSLDEDSISKMWGQKPMAEAFANSEDVKAQKQFMNRIADQMVEKNNGNKVKTASDFLRWSAMFQNGSKVETKGARGMIYRSVPSMMNEFFEVNFDFKDKQIFTEKNKETGESIRYLRFEKTDGTFTEKIPYPPTPPNKVSKQMINNNMSESEISLREKMADQAWNFSVDIYKSAKEQLDNKAATGLNVAMLMNGMGQFMEGPIRAAAPYRYAPVNPSTTSLRDENGNRNFEYEHGIPAKIVNLMIADAVFNKDSKVDLEKLKETYAVGVIEKSFNDNMSKFFGQRMQFDYKVGDIAPKRWYNRFTRGGAAHALEDVRTGDKFGEKEAELYQDYIEANEVNSSKLSNNVVNMKNLNSEEVLSYASTVDAALNAARDPNAPVKKIRVFDFDDTLATSKNLVFYTMPNGTKGQLNAEEFAKQGAELKDLGAVMDFTDFNTVREGGEGPLADLARTIIDKRGNEDVFVLTARAQESAQAIYDFLQGVGINIPFKNITGLGNSTGESKAQWIIEKAANGYNDFYFADDAPQNVKAVQDALDVVDVKSKVQQAKFKFSQNVDQQFNEILENSFGVEWYKEFSSAKAKMLGDKNQKRRIHPFSAEDFEGLIYPLLGKGTKGEAAYQWFDEHLFKPYTRAINNLATDRINLMDDFKKLKKTLKVPKSLSKTNSTGFTNENSVRAYIWDSLGYEVTGLSKADKKEIKQYIEANEDLKIFAESVLNISKGDYSTPGKSWMGGTITTDLIETLQGPKRKEYLTQWKQNVDIIFSDKNINKLEAMLGEKYVESLKNSLQRMESGSNRMYSNSRIANNVLDYLNNAQGVVMFLNMRSALLQSISAANFINFGFNNPLKAGAAFANQPQYWKDFMEIMNSDYLVDRRGGLKMNINENEVTNAAKTAKNKAKAAVSYIIEKGYAPTKFMDSFAIASGGATWFRNRINDLMKKDSSISESEAKKIAMEELRSIAEKSQQSSDPSKISSQQASTMGRIMLNWANTQMQYVRIQKKAVQDIANRRGDTKNHISKIIYYGAIQNLWFQAAHAAVFALGFGDDEEEMSSKELEAYETFKNKKIINTANGVTDNILRGLGFAGHTVSVLKNIGLDIYERSDRSRPEYVDAAWGLVKLSPVVSSKISRIKSAAWYFDSKKRRQEMIDKGFSIDNPAYDATAKVISAVTNVPLDRLMLKMDNVMEASKDETEFWMDAALLLGWPKWQLEPKAVKKKKGWGESSSDWGTASGWDKSKGWQKDESWGK